MLDFDTPELWIYLRGWGNSLLEVKKLYAALDKLDPLERDIVERYYVLEQPLGEIACDSDKSYHQFARLKRKALEKLRALM
jgi:DNA-directed RNA polymerase specialized sigma24 family protein